MDTLLAEKIIDEITKFSDIQCAITDEFGAVLSKSKNFSLNHPQINIKNRKSVTLRHAGKRFGYLYVDEPLAVKDRKGDFLKSIAEVVIEQVKHAEILTSDEKRLDQIAYDFFIADTIKPTDYQRVLQALGIFMKLNRTAIVVEICNPEYLLLFDREILEGEREKIIARAKRSIESILTVFYTKHPKNLVFYLGNTKFLILKDMGREPKKYQKEFKKTLTTLHFNLKNELRTDITIGVGEYTKGLKGIRESFGEASAALKFGRQTWGHNRIYHYDDFGVVAPLFRGINQESISFSSTIVEKITSKDLRTTLEIFFENNLSVGESAKVLKIHRNTLIYRLEKIFEVTALDPRVFDDAFQLRMALVLDRYHD